MGMMSIAGTTAFAQDMPGDADNFYISKEVTMQKVTFNNQYGMKVTGNLFTPDDFNENVKYPALIVGHPFGAVKEQSANLYATKMAERGFVTLSIDLSFWGESDGQPRNGVLPDVYAEDFSAAVDFLGTRTFVDRERIGVIGVCGSGGFAISAAKIDPRMKAIATVSMYDMGGSTRNALGHSQTLEQRKRIIEEAAEQRYVEFTGGETRYTGGTVHELTENTHPIQREFYDFYRTPRGEYTPEGSSSELTTHPTLTGNVKLMNFYPFADIETISPRPMLFIAGENAHSIEFSEEAYRLAAQPKELYIVKGAGHVDLYDRVDIIPWDKLTSFFTEHLKSKEDAMVEIKRSGSQPSMKVPDEWFTGKVSVAPLFNPPAPARASGASVTFEPGARTAWHSHPLGQTLIVTAGSGLIQQWGGPMEEIRPGDVVWIAPGVKHWHGASPTTSMIHIAIQEQLEGKSADWMEKVSDEQYLGK